MVIEKLLDILNSDRARFAKKALDYLDGEQDKHVVSLLDDRNSGRKDWKKKGIIPRHRGITKMIVEKSGLLFTDTAPLLDVYTNDPNNPDEEQSSKFLEIMESVDWVEYFTNFDSVVRLLKTGLILVQFDIETNSLVLDTLHRGNCAVITNPHNKEILTLIYQTHETDTEIGYRVFTKETISDYTVKDKKIIEGYSGENTYGMIPLAQFYDTHIPRSGFFVEAPKDLININDMYNLHITDSEYAATWAKLQTMVITDGEFTSGSSSGTELREVSDSSVPALVDSSPSLSVGPGETLNISSNGVGSTSVDFKGPDSSSLLPTAEMMDKWVRDFAADWSVRVKGEGQGNADSGFKLIVEEMDNLELRKKRAKMFQAGFKRLYTVVAKVYNYSNPNALAEDGKLMAKFNEPKLPVDKTNEENLWNIRIAAGRATNLDYYMQVFGLSREEAIEREKEIRNFEDNFVEEVEVPIEEPEVEELDPVDAEIKKLLQESEEE